MKKIDKKFIAEIARTLPRSVKEVLIHRQYTGKELLEAGVKASPGSTEEIVPHEIYSLRKKLPQPLSHERAMKNFFRRHPVLWREKYLEWFNAHHARMLEKYPELINRLNSKNGKS